MLVVGERINTSRKPIAEAAEKFDANFIIDEAKRQAQAGADMIDVNAGSFAEKEVEYLTWMVQTLHDQVDAPLCIDSSDPKVVRAALDICGGGVMVNSISAERELYEEMAPLIKGHDCKVVALCMDDEGIPDELDKKLGIGFRLVDKLLADGVEIGDIYVDPLVMAVATRNDSGMIALDTIRKIKQRYAGIHTICGLSNISFGLPARKLMNRSFLVMAMAAGLDAVILDPLDKQMMASVITANTLLGRDDFCGEYLAAYRDKRLE